MPSSYFSSGLRFACTGSVRDDSPPILATTAVFVMTGFVGASWAARLPATQERLHLSEGALALAVLGIEGGALLGLTAGGLLVGRRGSRASVRLGFAGYAVLLFPLALVPSLGTLTATLVIWAAANSVVDVAMNAAGVELEARIDGSLLSRLHAGQSGGLLAGGLVATGAAAGRIPLPLHFAGVAVVAVFVVLASSGRLPAHASGTGGRRLGIPDRHLLLLGSLAFCVFFVDGTVSNWVAVALRSEQHADAALAAAGYTGVTAAVAVVRFVGDRVLGRYRRSRVVRVSGVVAAIGAAAVVLAPAASVALVGWMIVGAGFALLAPAVVGAAPYVRAVSSPVAIASVTTLGYLGSFTGPPLIGALAGLGSLSGALGLLVVAALVVAVLARRAIPPTAEPGRRRSQSPGAARHR